MARVHVVLDSDPARLLERAAEPLLAPRVDGTGAFASPPCLLVLRQGGLRDDLLRLAAARGVPGWFSPPLAVFHELPARLGATGRRPLGDVERTALLSRILREQGGATFRDRVPGFVHAVDQLFGELWAEEVSAADWARATDALGPREAFEVQRDADLGRAYAAYLEELERLGRRDGRDTLADTAAAVRGSPAELEARLDGRREIRIHGLADLRGGWRALLAALKESPAFDSVILYAAVRLPLPPALEASEEYLGEPPDDRLVPPGLAAFHIIVEPDQDRELEAVSSRIRDLVEEGTPPGRIAVVPRQARPLADLAASALERASVPATARRRIPWREVPCIRALLALFEAAGEGWTRHGLVELGSQPYFASDIDPRVVNFLGHRERVTGLAAWSAAFDRLCREARAAAETPADEGERPPRTLPVEWVEEAAERFRGFAALAAGLEAARPLPDWLEWLSEWIKRDPWQVERRLARVPEDRWDVVRLDLLAWRGLRGLLAEWSEAERQWPGQDGALGPAGFLLRLRAMLEGDLALWWGPARGVQVAEVLAASHRSFDHVFLVGMNAGRFPRRAPSSLLLGARDREALRAAGLPLDTTADWDARERELFRVLVAGAARSLTVSYATLDETGADAIPSAFAEALSAAARGERVTWRPVPFPGGPALAVHAHRTASIERIRATGLLSPWNGAIEDEALHAWLAEEFGDARMWSPTRIEEYAKCPWAWFSGRLLRLELREDPDGDMDPRARGSVLHDALRRFYEAAAARIGGPVYLTPDDAEWARALLRESLHQAMAAAGSAIWLGHPALRPVKHAELERMLLDYLAFEMDENRKALAGRGNAGKMVRTAVVEHEVAFEDVVLERDGVRFRFGGRMDRIEVGVDDRALGSWVATVDYKTTKYACPGAGQAAAWEDGVVLQVPLYAWALAAIRPGARVARVEYRAIKQAARIHALSLVKVSRRGVDEGDEERARMESALSAVARHVKRVRAGEFPAAPAPSCNCPPFCHGWDICRVKGGPSTGRD